LLGEKEKMKKIYYGHSKSRHQEYLHMLRFSFENQIFEAYVVETKSQTFVRDCHHNYDEGNNLSNKIDIPEFFGKGFSDQVFKFIFANIKEQLK
jgi:hypothetical protein